MQVFSCPHAIIVTSLHCSYRYCIQLPLKGKHAVEISYPLALLCVKTQEREQTHIPFSFHVWNVSQILHPHRFSFWIKHTTQVFEKCHSPYYGSFFRSSLTDFRFPIWHVLHRFIMFHSPEFISFLQLLGLMICFPKQQIPTDTNIISSSKFSSNIAVIAQLSSL